MIILFAPAKTFSKQPDLMSFSPLFEEKTNEIAKKLSDSSLEEIKNVFKTSEAISKTVLTYYKSFDTNQSFAPLTLFEGEAYKTLDYKMLSEQAKAFLDKHLIIPDAFYGIIKPNLGIKPYRLDFTIAGMGLRKYWENDINTYINSQHSKTILSLAYKEFSSLIDQKKFELFEVSFLDFDGQKYKSISVFNKQNRGLLLKYIAEHQIEDIDSLPINFNGYKLSIIGHQYVYKR